MRGRSISKKEEKGIKCLTCSMDSKPAKEERCFLVPFDRGRK